MIALFVVSLFCAEFPSGNILKQKSSVRTFSGFKAKKYKNLVPNSGTATDKEGCYAAYEALAESLKPTTAKKIEKKPGILSGKTLLQSFTELCLATAAKEDCATLIVKLTPDADSGEVAATPEEKATFTTDCNVEKPKVPDTDTDSNDDDDIFSFNLNNSLLLISTILINLYFMI
jgi:hypothetical protein